MGWVVFSGVCLATAGRFSGLGFWWRATSEACNINERLKQSFIMQEKISTNVHFASALARLIDKKALSDVQVSKAIGVTPTAIGNYKKGRVPRAEELHRLARFFGVSMESLLTGNAQVSSEDGSWRLRALTAETRMEDLKTAMLQVVKKF